MFAIVVGTVIGTLGAAVITHYYRSWRRRCAKCNQTKAGKLGDLQP